MFKSRFSEFNNFDNGLTGKMFSFLNGNRTSGVTPRMTVNNSSNLRPHHPKHFTKFCKVVLSFCKKRSNFRYLFIRKTCHSVFLAFKVSLSPPIDSVSGIIQISSKIKVVGIAARFIVAFVKNVKMVGKRSKSNPIRNPMGVSIFPFHGNHAVFVNPFCWYPVPAFRKQSSFDFGPQSSFQCSSRCFPSKRGNRRRRSGKFCWTTS